MSVLRDYRESALIFSDVIQGLHNIQQIELKDEMVVETRSHGRGIIFKSGRSVRRFVGDTFIERQLDNFDIPVNIPQDHVIFFPIRNIVRDNEIAPFYCLPRDEIVKVHVFRDNVHHKARVHESTVVPVSSSSSGSKLRRMGETSCGSGCEDTKEENKRSLNELQYDDITLFDNETIYHPLEFQDGDFSHHHKTTDSSNTTRRRSSQSEENKTVKKKRADTTDSFYQGITRSHRHVREEGIVNNWNISGQQGGVESDVALDKSVSLKTPDIRFKQLSDDEVLCERVRKGAVFSIIFQRLRKYHGWDYIESPMNALGKDLTVPPDTNEVYLLPGRSTRKSGMQWGLDCFFSHEAVLEYLTNCTKQESSL